jgi:hypothetical protein
MDCREHCNPVVAAACAQSTANLGLAWARRVGLLVPIAGSQPAVWGLLAWPNNGGGPGVPSRTKKKICWITTLIVLAEVSCSGRLHRQTTLALHAYRSLDRIGSGRLLPCFYLTVWFQRERGEAPPCYHHVARFLAP